MEFSETKISIYFGGNTDSVTSHAIFVSGKNKFLASGSYDKTINFWNLTNYTFVSTLLGIDSKDWSLLSFQETENSEPHSICKHDNGEIVMWSD